MRNSQDISRAAKDYILPDVRLKELFDSCRLIDKNNILKIIVYFPFGFLLLVVRLITCITGLFILSLLPRTSAWSSIFKGLCKILGLVIRVDDKYLDESTKLFIANHVSILDRLAVNMMKPCNTITEKFQLKDMDVLSFWKDHDVLYCRDLNENDLSALKSCVEGSSISVLHFPERATTSGKVGLLKFHPAVFSLNFSIQPVLVQVSLSSFVTVSPSILGSNVCADILWPFFVPQMYYNLKVLPSMAKLPEESAMDFSKRVQQTMAKAMGLTATVYTSTDKFELVKELMTSRAQNSSDTSKKENASATEQYSQIINRSRELAAKEKLSLNTAAKSFGKSPRERMFSYQERKSLLIEASRIKYLEKHNML